jgi:hypothetical protein
MMPHLPFRDCLAHLDAHCGGDLLDGRSPDEVLAMLERSEQPGPYDEALRMLVEWLPLRDAGQTVTRIELIQALGPLRLRYQTQDGDTESYRALVRLICAIDAAYDELADAATCDFDGH